MTMTFGQAVEAMKQSRFIRRAGWNGKGMHVYLEDAQSFTIGEGVFKGKKREHAAYMVLLTPSGVHQPGWNASTADVLADDWEVCGP